MTVVTKSIIAKKEDEKAKEALVVHVGDCEEAAGDRVEVRVADNEYSFLANESLRKAALIYTQTVLTVGVLLSIFAAITGALHIMRSPRNYRGYCQVPFLASLDENSMITGWLRSQEEQNHGPPKPLRPLLEVDITEKVRTIEKMKEDGTIEFDYELDLETDEFEVFQLPEISHGRYLHDFKVNKTAIIDPDGNRCFIMDLDAEAIPRPRTILEVIDNLKAGSYDVDINELRVDTNVVLPPLENVAHLGIFIETLCGGMTSYMLEPFEDNKVLVKRDAEVEHKHPFQFMEFTGKKMITYNIANLAAIEKN